MRSYIRVFRARDPNNEIRVHYGRTAEEATNGGQYVDPIRVWFFLPNRDTLINSLNFQDTAFIEFVFENAWGLTDADPWPEIPN